MRGQILVAEDDISCRRWIEAVLERAGHKVTGVVSGEEAIERMGQETYEVVLLDLVMPGLGGLDVLTWMQTHAPKTVAVVLSGTQSVQDALHAIQTGAYDFLSKPVESSEILLQRLARALEHKRLRDSRDCLLEEVQEKNIELENRLGQLELAHSILKSQAVTIQTDLNRAMRIQQGLLPQQSPLPDRVSLSALYRPMAKVGGDLFDVFSLGEDQLAFYIADASGHGVSSAMLTVFLKHAIQRAVRDPEKGTLRDPGAVLLDVNKTVISEAFGQGVFISLTYGLLDTVTGVVHYSNAGHPPLLLIHGDHRIERLHRASPVLGVNPKVLYTHGEFTMQPGDILVLYTDGITEARNVHGRFFGVERLCETLATAERHTDVVRKAVETGLMHFCEGAESSDDATLVVLGREPQRVQEPMPLEPEAPAEPITAGATVMTAERDGIVFISITGTGSWRESQHILDLANQARTAGARTIVLDLGNCNHLDSTFMGVLHNIVISFEEAETDTPPPINTVVSGQPCRFEIQNAPRSLLRLMSELGLTSVLLHFRPEPLSLPPSMLSIDAGPPEGEAMGRLLLWAHESLVEADPSNADRFAAVLEVLHARAKSAT